MNSISVRKANGGWELMYKLDLCSAIHKKQYGDTPPADIVSF